MTVDESIGKDGPVHAGGAGSAGGEPPVRVAVVGHTNTGKTSLLRTLTRDVDFGEVSDRPAVTRRVQGKALLVEGRPVLELYDTPGLEDSSGLLDYLDGLAGRDGTRRPDWPRVVEQFLESTEARSRFAQEAAALRQVHEADLALYVIDARDRVLGKHRDELEILGRCARPVVPVLNFVASAEARTAEWREHLARLNMHAAAEFDTVVVDEQGERRLYEKMQSLLDARRSVFEILIADRREQRRRLLGSASRMVADMLIDASAFVLVVRKCDDFSSTSLAMDEMRQRVRDREQGCLQQLLELFRFREDDGCLEELSIVDGRWGLDVFGKAAMKRFGARAGGAAAAGAVAGLAVDAMAGGITLGAATATGAAIGALLETGRSFGRKIVDRARGKSELRVDDSTVRLLAIRQIALLRALLRRGHAAIEPVTVRAGGEADAGGAGATRAEARSRARADAAPDAQASAGRSGSAGSAVIAAPPKLERRLPGPLVESRGRPTWSRLTRAAVGTSRPMSASVAEARDAAESELAAWVREKV